MRPISRSRRSGSLLRMSGPGRYTVARARPRGGRSSSSIASASASSPVAAAARIWRLSLTAAPGQGPDAHQPTETLGNPRGRGDLPEGERAPVRRRHRRAGDEAERRPDAAQIPGRPERRAQRGRGSQGTHALERADPVPRRGNARRDRGPELRRESLLLRPTTPRLSREQRGGAVRSAPPRTATRIRRSRSRHDGPAARRRGAGGGAPPAATRRPPRRRAVPPPRSRRAGRAAPTPGSAGRA